MTKQLEQLATKALQRHGGDIEKALPQFVRDATVAKLIDDLARDFLQRVAGRGLGRTDAEARTAAAKPTPPKGSIKVKQHGVTAHRRRTPEEKAAAMEAMMATASAVFEMKINGRALGNIRIGELATLKRDLIADASNKLMLGTEQARNAVLAELIEQHATVHDQLMPVREAINAKTLNELVAQADQEAPRRIAEGMRRAAQAMEQKELRA